MDIATIELSASNYRQGETVRGRARVKLEGKARFPAAVELFWQDSHGRVLGRIERKARFPASQAVNFAFKLDKFPMSMVNAIVLQVTDELLVRRARAEARFTITPPRSNWDDYEMILWGERREWAGEAFVQSLVQTGVTAGMAYAVRPHQKRRDHNWLADGDLKFYVENVCQIGWDGKLAGRFTDDFVAPAYRKGNDRAPDKRYLVRKPCMNDPAYWAECRRRIHDEVRARDEFSPIAYNIGDEQSIAFFTTPYDFCFSDHCLAEFRKWLRGHYASLGRLNETWETNFSSWDQVAPLTREEVRARESSSFAPWADHRDFMDTQIARFIGRLCSYFHEIDPSIVVGIEGTQKPAIYGGFDYWKLSKLPVRFHEIYDIGGSHRIVSSFNRNRCAVINLIGVDRDHRARLWQKLFHGDRGSVIWWMPAFHTPAGEVRQPAKDQTAVWNELTGGIANLLDFEKSAHDGVAIHYSPASCRGYWITMKDIPFTGDHEIANTIDLERLGVMRLIEDLGYAYRFVSYEQIETGGLDKQKVKLLFLPGSVAISDAEAVAIRRWVRKGGVVVADYQAGWMDQHCKWRKAGVLDDVFGVTREDFSTERWNTHTSKRGGGYWLEHVPPLDARQVLVDKDFESVRLIANRLVYPTVESTLEPTTGVAVAHEGDNPALVINRFGRGAAVYLNFRLLYYTHHRMSAKDQVLTTQTLRTFGPLLRHFGVAPAVELTCPVAVERVSFVDGAADYVCLRRNPSEEQGGLGEMPGGTTDFDKPVSVTVKSKTAAHTYDLRAGKYLGCRDVVSVKLTHPEPVILARLPYTVDDLDVQAADRCARGGRLTARISLFSRTRKPKQKFVRHVLRCRLFGPDTLERTAARRNIETATGRATYVFDLALNEMAGTWRVVVRDVNTGAEREVAFEAPGEQR